MGYECPGYKDNTGFFIYLSDRWNKAKIKII